MDDPSHRTSLADRTIAYVREHLLLRILLVVTVIDHLAAMALVVSGRLHVQIGGMAALFSVLSWFFAVCIPVMNRELRARLGAPRSLAWADRMDKFWRIVLSGVTGLYTVLLLRAALGV